MKPAFSFSEDAVKVIAVSALQYRCCCRLPMNEGETVSIQVSGFSFRVSPDRLFSEKEALSQVRRKSSEGSSVFSKGMVYEKLPLCGVAPGCLFSLKGAS